MNKLVLAAAAVLSAAAMGYVAFVGGEPRVEQRLAAVSPAPAPPFPLPGAAPFPVALEIDFDLINHHGRRVTDDSLRGTPMLLFFGFASCESLCTHVLPDMGHALSLLGDEGEDIEAFMITIDPARDTPELMRTNLARWHERLVGLTGSEAELEQLRKTFQVDVAVVAEDPTGAPIYQHGGFIYFIGADGQMKTMIPPILGPERIADLARKYFLTPS